jgi:hypothetical protein
MTGGPFRTSFEGNESVDFAFDDAAVFTFDEAFELDGVDLAFGDGVDLLFDLAFNDTFDFADIAGSSFDCTDAFRGTGAVDFVFDDASSLV